MRWFASLVLALALGVMGCRDGGSGEARACDDRFDCPAVDYDPCTEAMCIDGMCEIGPTPVEREQVCFDLEKRITGVCDGSGTCAECLNDGHCADRSECTADTCDSVSATCNFAPVADGTECAGGTCRSGMCELGSVLPCTEQGIRNAALAGGGPYTFDCAGPETVAVESAIVVERSVVLDGEGKLVVAGDYESLLFAKPVFVIGQDAVAELRGVVITDGSPQISNWGTLTLEDSTVLANLPRGREGIVNYSGGVLTLRGVTVSETTGRNAISNRGGILTMTNCTVVGSVYGAPSGLFDVIDSTVSSSASGEPAVLLGGALALKGALVEGHCEYAEPIREPLISNGYNIESPGNTCGFDQPTDQVNVSAEDLKLGPLQDNGGPTETHALGAGSVAIDVIPEAECVDAEGDPLTTDQRGLPRDSMCDVGAFEVQP